MLMNKIERCVLLHYDLLLSKYWRYCDVSRFKRTEQTAPCYDYVYVNVPWGVRCNQRSTNILDLKVYDTMSRAHKRAIAKERKITTDRHNRQVDRTDWNVLCNDWGACLVHTSQIRGFQ